MLQMKFMEARKRCSAKSTRVLWLASGASCWCTVDRGDGKRPRCSWYKSWCSARSIQVPWLASEFSHGHTVNKGS